MTHTEANKPVHQEAATAPEPGRIGKLKTAFLYTLIGGLAASAIVAIAAILVGEFNTSLQRAFGTIFIFVTHSLFILGLIWSDKHNHLGRSIIPTVILGVALANIVTTTLGAWEIIAAETAWRAVLFYFLLIGSSFIVAGALKLRVAHKPTLALLYSSIALVTLWTLLLAPWVFEVVERFNPLYFRAVGALTILATTVFLIAIIIRAIAVAHSAALRVKASPDKPRLSGGMLAIYITIGVFAVFTWFGGFIALIVDAVSDTNYYERPNNYRLY